MLYIILLSFEHERFLEEQNWMAMFVSVKFRPGCFSLTFSPIVNTFHK